MSNAFKPQTAEDIEKLIEKYRKSYAPEWKFDRDNPDAGSVIAQIYARQVEENNRLMSQMPERYHLEFVNMLDSNLRPAQPAGSMVVFNMDTETLMGTQVNKGTRLTADSSDSESGFIIYETDRNIFVTEAQIRSVFLTDFERGTLSPVFGELAGPEIITGAVQPLSSDEETSEAESLMEEAELEEDFAARYRIPPFTLFGETSTIGQSVLTMYERRLFDGVNEAIYIRLEDADEVIQRILDGKLVFKFFSKKGFEPFSQVKLLEDKKTFAIKW